MSEFGCDKGEIHGSRDRCPGGCRIVSMDGKSARQLAWEAAHESPPAKDCGCEVCDPVVQDKES